MNLWTLIIGLAAILSVFTEPAVNPNPLGAPVSSLDPHLFEGNYRSPWPYYEYDIPLYGMPTPNKYLVLQANEFELRTMLCAYDVACHKVFPLTEAEWEIVAAQLHDAGYAAHRTLVR